MVTALFVKGRTPHVPCPHVHWLRTRVAGVKLWGTSEWGLYVWLL